ncbi:MULTISPECIES: type 4 pilus major pilin [Escherichia]|uniref:type 4 pilus major pilin n=1 Tax=Escherichia TaxID=561 RepID=UPI000FAFB76F|nr:MULTISPECIES: type 4 pilus major pilin [Escherichia]EAC0978363.1 pilus assembly protein PilX [Salmonella enterica subsp. enterica serovar Saintpaul]EBD7775194.1 pilus assembly protein PilX [Salmonella enterica]ECA5571073.1 pilus assembly protein PilX [Salmonella enterica subsp. enterica serovar Give]ECN6990477.1 pilus assembly protein PilX [Salmonella enterica subsp. enterica serovar Typhimurium]EDA6986802.1 pilus assembly protein PilX [Salmonella enterica subsp. enterica serovar Enteritidi
MLIQNINANVLKKNEKETSHDKGWGIMEQGAIALVVIIVLALVFGGLYMLRSRTSVANESSNIQTIITSTQGLLKGSDGYTFTSGAKMTGALIQMGGVPKTMTVRGTPSSGTATLYNSWGGDVTVAPASTSGFNNGFTVTYEKVPQDACIQIATQISRTGLTNGITLNSTAHSDGKVTTEEASAQCTADNGSTGTNRLIFTING